MGNGDGEGAASARKSGERSDGGVIHEGVGGVEGVDAIGG